MKNERDDELAELLNDQNVPDHGPDFWSNLGDALADEPAPMADVEVTDPTDAPAGAETIELEPEEAAVTDIASHPRFRAWGVALVGVAAVAIAAVIGINLAGEDDGQQPVSNSTSIPQTTAEAPDSENDYSLVTSRTELGLGAVAGWTPDGSGVLVITDAPGDQLGAEGVPLLTLWVRPLDGSEAYLAFDDGRTIQTGGGDFAFGRNGDVAWSEWCDGVSCGLFMGQMAADGTITGVQEVTIPGQLDDAPVISDMAWGDDGTLYLIINEAAYAVNTVDLAAETLDQPASFLLEVDDGLGEVAPGSGIAHRAQPTDGIAYANEVGPLSFVGSGFGEAVVRSTEGAATNLEVYDVGPYDRLAAIEVGPVNGLTWAPAGDTVFWYGDGLGALTVRADGGSESMLLPAGVAVQHAAFSPTATALAITSFKEGIPQVEVLFFGAIASEGDPAAVTPVPSDAAPVPVGLIDGIVVGLLDDQNALVLRDDFESTGPACGDGPPQALWQVPLDETEPTLLSPGLGSPALYYRSPGDHIAYISGCEAFDTLTVEDLANDNNEILSVNAAAVPSTGGDVIGFTEIDWVDDNVLLLTGFVESGEGRAWRVEIDTSVVEELVDQSGSAYPDVVDVAIGLEGELMLVGTDYFASVDDPTPLDGEAVGGLSMNGPIAYNRPGELWRLGLDEAYADFEAEQLFVSRDGTHVFAIEKEQTGLRLLEIELEGTFLQENRSWPVVDADGEQGWFTTDSSKFVYSARVENGRGGDADGFEVRLLDFDSTGDETIPVTTEVLSPPGTTPNTLPTCTRQTPPALGSDDDSVPQPVFETQQAIVIAAASCDYGDLASLAGDDLFIGFNVPEGMAPLQFWLDSEDSGVSYAELYVDLLTGRGAPRVGDDGVTRWLWPAVAAYDTVEEIPADVLADHLAQTGITQEVFELDWDIFGLYPLLTISIAEDGTWVAAAPAE